MTKREIALMKGVAGVLAEIQKLRLEAMADPKLRNCLSLAGPLDTAKEALAGGLLQFTVAAVPDKTSQQAALMSWILQQSDKEQVMAKKKKPAKQKKPTKQKQTSGRKQKTKPEPIQATEPVLTLCENCSVEFPSDESHACDACGKDPLCPQCVCEGCPGED